MSLFLVVHLLAPTGYRCFCLMEVYGLTVGFAIDEAKSIGGEVAVGFPR